MADSVCKRILDAAEAALNNGAGKPGAVFRTRTAALASGEMPAYLMYPVQDEAQRVSVGTVERQLTIGFEAFTAGAAPQDEALDPLLTYVPLTLWADSAFRGLVQSMLDAKIIWEFKAGEEDFALASLQLKVTYLVAQGDPTVQKSNYTAVLSVSANGTNWFTLGELADLAFDISIMPIDTTNLESLGEESAPGLQTWKASARELFLNGDVGQSAIADAVLAGTPMQFRFDPAGTGAGNDRYSGAGFVSGCKFTQQPSPQQPVWQALQFQGSGPLARSTQ